MLYKLNYFKSGNAAPLYPDTATISQHIPDKEGQQFFLSQACRSITIRKKGAFPYKPQPNERILLAGPSDFPSYFSEARKRYPIAAEFKYDYEMGPIQADWMGNNIEKMAQSYDTIIICAANERNASVAARLAKSGKRVIIVSVLSPVPVLNFTWADTIALGYSYSPYTFQAIFGALNGEYEPQGILPLK